MLFFFILGGKAIKVFLFYMSTSRIGGGVYTLDSLKNWFCGGKESIVCSCLCQGYTVLVSTGLCPSQPSVCPRISNYSRSNHIHLTQMAFNKLPSFISLC